MTVRELQQQEMGADREDVGVQHLIERCDILRTFSDETDDRNAPIENPRKVGSKVPCAVILGVRPPQLDPSLERLHQTLKTTLYVPAGTDVLTKDEIRVYPSEDYPDHPMREYVVEETDEPASIALLLAVHVSPKR